MPPSKCARKPPPPPTNADDTTLALYLDAKDKAGDDCRDKADALDTAIGKWPKNPPPVGQ